MVISAFEIISLALSIVALTVSMWQTLWPYRVRVKITAKTVTHVLYDGKSFNAEKFFWIKFQNVGPAGASIACWGIKIDRKQWFYTQRFESAPLPLQSKTLMERGFPLQMLQNAVRDLSIKKNKPLRVFIREVGGKEFILKTDIKVNDLLGMKKDDFSYTISEDDYMESSLRNADVEVLQSYLRGQGSNDR